MTNPNFDDDWGRPAETGGEFVKPKDLLGHLLIVFPLGHIPHIQTRFSQPGKRSDAIQVDIIDLDDKDEYGMPGKVYRTCNWMQAQLIQALRPMIGNKVLGTVGLGISKNGMNQPWVIIDASGDEAARGRANAWKLANPSFRPSVFVQRTEEPPQQPPIAQQVGPQPQYHQQPYPQPQPSYQPPQQQQPYPQPQPQYTPPSQPQYPPGARTPAYPVQGAAPVSPGEMTMLEQMRQEHARRMREQEAQFGDQPPF